MRTPGLLDKYRSQKIGNAVKGLCERGSRSHPTIPFATPYAPLTPRSHPVGPLTGRHSRLTRNGLVPSRPSNRNPDQSDVLRLALNHQVPIIRRHGSPRTAQTRGSWSARRLIHPLYHSTLESAAYPYPPPGDALGR